MKENVKQGFQECETGVFMRGSKIAARLCAGPIRAMLRNHLYDRQFQLFVSNDHFCQR